MGKSPSAPPHEFSFAADWESCDAKRTYRPPWKPAGSTPGTLKLWSGRAYRVTVRPETRPADLAAILRAAPEAHIRTVRIPRGGPIAAADLGGVLAKLRGVEAVSLYCPYDSTDWTVNLRRAGGVTTQLALDGWPVAEVVATAGRVPRAAALTIRTDGDGTPFALGPLFAIRGLKRVDVQHSHYSNQELDWTGLSGLKGLRSLRTDYGILPKSLWRELGSLPRLNEKRFQKGPGS